MSSSSSLPDCETFDQMHDMLETFRETEEEMRIMYSTSGSGAVSSVFGIKDFDEQKFTRSDPVGSTYRVKLVIDHLQLETPELEDLNKACSEANSIREDIVTPLNQLRIGGRAPDQVFAANLFSLAPSPRSGSGIIKNILLTGVVCASHNELKSRRAAAAAALALASQAESSSNTNTDQGQQPGAGSEVTQQTSTDEDKETSTTDSTATAMATTGTTDSVDPISAMHARLQQLLGEVRSINGRVIS